MPTTLSATLKLLFITLFAAASAQAQFVLEDSFDNGDRSSPVVWHVDNGTQPGSIVESGSQLTMSGLNGSNQYLSAYWDGSMLAGAGYAIKMMVTARYTDTGASVDSRSNEFNFSLGYNGNTPLTGDRTGPSIDDFGFTLSLGGSNSSAGGFDVRQDAGGDRWLGAGNDVSDLTTTGDFFTFTEDFVTYTMTITRDEADLFDIVVSNGTNTVIAENITPTSFDFNSVTLGWYGRSADNTLDIQSVQVQFIPEPSTYAMLVAGLLAIVFIVRRRR